MYYVTPEDVAIAKENGIHEKLVYSRVYQEGMTIERATTQPVRERNMYKWKEHKHLAQQNDISYQLYHRRVNAGYTYIQAATMPKHTIKQKEQKMRNNRKRMFTDEELAIAKSNGVTPHRANARVRRFNWSKEDAISTPPLKRGEYHENARVKGFKTSIENQYKIDTAKRKRA